MLRVRGTLPLLIALAGAASAMLMLAYSSTLDPIDALMGRGAVAEVPDVAGRPLPRARAEVEEVGLRAEVVSGYSLTAPRGTIIQQDPAAGERLREGATVELVVSQGANRVEMPDAVGRPLDEVTPPLDDAGVEYEVLALPHERIPEGEVVAQVPDPGVVVTGVDTPTFAVSSGPAERPVPEVVGLSLNAASFRLGESGLGVEEVVLVDHDTVTAGAVVEADPPVGTSLERDATVTLTVSVGAAPVAVPDVTNVTRATAIGRLEALGFNVETAGRLVGPDGFGEGNVFEQQPVDGTMMRPGEAVTIVVGRLPPDPTPPRPGGVPPGGRGDG